MSIRLARTTSSASAPARSRCPASTPPAASPPWASRRSPASGATPNCGGDFANALKGSGYDIVFFEGRAERPVYLLIDNGRVEIKDARGLWGKDTTLTEQLVRQENGNNRLKVAAIGPGGERLSRIAAVMNDRGRAAARSGLGAVMGSKNLKAVACVGSMKPEILDKPRIQALMKEMIKRDEGEPVGHVLRAQPRRHSGRHDHAHARSRCAHQELGRQHRRGLSRVEMGIGGLGRHGQIRQQEVRLRGLPDRAAARCSRSRRASIPVRDVAQARVRDPGGVRAHVSQRRHGIPHLRERAVQPLRARYHLGRRHAWPLPSTATRTACISKADTDGLELTWGNSDAHVAMLEKMCRREGIGDVLADGAKWAAQKIGGGAESLAMHAGGEMLAMHDPRCFPGWGATYISDSTPGRHTRGGTAFPEHGGVNERAYAGMGVPFKLEPYDPTDKGKYHALLAGWQHWVNTSGACLFGVDSMPLDFVGCMNAITGWGLDYEEIIETGNRITTLLHAFNLREGFKPERLPAAREGAGQSSAADRSARGSHHRFGGL